MRPRDPWDDDLDILSAENVNFAMETAGLGSRFGAVLIDLCFQLLVLILLWIVCDKLLDFVPKFQWSAWVRSLLRYFAWIGSFAVMFCYFFLFEWLWDGQTPGKRILGMRVLQVEGTPITAFNSMTRNVVRFVDIVPPFYGIGGLVALLGPNNRRVGDLVAGTIVARERHEATDRRLIDIGAAAAAFLAASAAGAANSVEPAVATGYPASNGEAPILMGLREDEVELIHEFQLRRENLKPLARRRLAAVLATRLATRLGQPAPSEVGAEAWLDSLGQTYSSLAA